MLFRVAVRSPFGSHVEFYPTIRASVKVRFRIQIKRTSENPGTGKTEMGFPLESSRLARPGGARNRGLPSPVRAPGRLGERCRGSLHRRRASQERTSRRDFASANPVPSVSVLSDSPQAFPLRFVSSRFKTSYLPHVCGIPLWCKISSFRWTTCPRYRAATVPDAASAFARLSLCTAPSGPCTDFVETKR